MWIGKRDRITIYRDLKRRREERFIDLNDEIRRYKGRKGSNEFVMIVKLHGGASGRKRDGKATRDGGALCGDGAPLNTHLQLQRMRERFAGFPKARSANSRAILGRRLG